MDTTSDENGNLLPPDDGDQNDNPEPVNQEEAPQIGNLFVFPLPIKPKALGVFQSLAELFNTSPDHIMATIIAQHAMMLAPLAHLQRIKSASDDFSAIMKHEDRPNGMGMRFGKIAMDMLDNLETLDLGSFVEQVREVYSFDPEVDAKLREEIASENGVESAPLDLPAVTDDFFDSILNGLGQMEREREEKIDEGDVNPGGDEDGAPC